MLSDWFFVGEIIIRILLVFFSISREYWKMPSETGNEMSLPILWSHEQNPAGPLSAWMQPSSWMPMGDCLDARCNPGTWQSPVSISPCRQNQTATPVPLLYSPHFPTDQPNILCGL